MANLMSSTLKRLTDAADRKNTIDKMLNDALDQKCSLYLNVKDNAVLSFDVVHYIPNSNGGTQKITTSRNTTSVTLTVGEKLLLTNKAIQEFAIHDNIAGGNLSKVFAPSEGLEINNRQQLSSYSHRDIFIKQSSSESRASYIKLIELAITELGKSPNSKPNARSVHKWITSELAKNNSQHSEYLEDISVYDADKKIGDAGYDPDLEEYSSTLDSNNVLKYGSKYVTRKNFKNKVSQLNTK